MNDTTVAQIIYEQLGGGRFSIMTGASNLIAANDGLSFRLPSNFAKNGANVVRVTLTPADVYKVEFLKVRGGKVTTLSVHEDIYCDQLQEMFTRETGLVLQMPRFVRRHEA